MMIFLFSNYKTRDLLPAKKNKIYSRHYHYER